MFKCSAWKMCFISLWCVALVLALSTKRAYSTIIPYPPTINEMALKSDLVIKAKVISTAPVKVSSGFPLVCDSWKIYNAKLQVISTLKGVTDSKNLEFLYRSDVAPQDKPQMWINGGPENFAHFRLEPGVTYILFAKKQGSDGPFVQLSSSYTMRSSEGFFRAADESEISSKISPTTAVWNELARQLKSTTAQTVKYAALTLLDLSADTSAGQSIPADFDRDAVLTEIFANNNEPPSVLRSDDFLKTFIAGVGDMSPYTSNDRCLRYLWAKADTPIGSWSPWNNRANVKARSAVPFLIKIANGKHRPEVCAAAVAALGLCQSDPKIAAVIKARLSSWVSSPVPEIRAAAVLLSCDYPGAGDVSANIGLMQDASPVVRKAAALAAGIARKTEAIPQLEKLLKDAAPAVQAAAALSLTTFPVESVDRILRANLLSKDFGTGFLARLAGKNPSSVREQLLVECEIPFSLASPDPAITPQKMDFQNGLATMPHYLCQRALLKYLDETPGAKLSQREYSKFLDCLEKNALSDGSLTAAVYELLLTHGLDARATAFKKLALASQPGIVVDITFSQPERLLKAGVLKFK